MIKRIEINENHSIELNGSVGWLIIYRNTFGRDILPDIMPILESFIGVSIEMLHRSKKKTEINVRDMIAALDEEMLSDIFINLAGMETMTVLQIVWAMAKKADKKIPNFEDYFDQFDVFPLDVVVPEVIRLIIESSVSTKNSTSLLTSLSEMKPNLSH